MAVVKANAYGHGALEVTRALAGQVDLFGVANVAEARECLEPAQGTSIFLLGAVLPQEREAAVRGGFLFGLSSGDEAAAFAALADWAPGGRVRAHLVVDTGMGRMGVWHEDALAVARQIAALPGIELTGVCSHLPSADEDEDFTRGQLATFSAVVANLRAAGIAVPVVHIENSAGLIGFAGQVGTFARTGLALYGVSPIPDFQARLRPVLAWKTRVILVRDFAAGRGVSYGRTFITPQPMRVATLAAGYADGYPRQASGRGANVLIGGQRCAILGRVTMDQIMVDVSAVPSVQAGEEAVLLGAQGGAEISANDVAAWGGTIPWHVFTGIGARVGRRYVGGI